MPEAAPRHERVPNMLYDARLPGESYEAYRNRRHRDQKAIDEYLRTGHPIDRPKPSSRVLRRLLQGKRTISGLSAQEWAYIKGILGVTEDRVNLLASVFNGSVSLVGHKKVRDFNFFAEVPYAAS